MLLGQHIGQAAVLLVGIALSDPLAHLQINGVRNLARGRAAAIALSQGGGPIGAVAGSRSPHLPQR